MNVCVGSMDSHTRIESVYICVINFKKFIPKQINKFFIILYTLLIRVEIQNSLKSMPQDLTLLLEKFWFLLQLIIRLKMKK